MAQKPDELTRARKAGNHKRNPDEILDDIRRARAEMSVTAGEVRTRLDPERLKAQAKEQVREATVGRAKNMAENMSMKARGYSRSMKDRIKDNPIPAAMTAIGIGWLMWGSREKAHEKHKGYDYGYMVSSEGLRSDYPESMETAASPCGTMGAYSAMASGRSAEFERGGAREGESAQEYRERMGEKAREMRAQMSERAQEYRARMSDKASQYRESAKHYYQSGRERAVHAGQSLQSRYEHNPLGMGLAIMAAGALAGLAFKETRWEHETMGPYRDKMLSSAQEAGSERLHQVAEKAAEKVHEARERMEAKTGEAESRMGGTSGEWRGASSPCVGHPTVGDTRPRSEHMAQEEPAPMDKPSKVSSTR